jgi:hypothetical protein
MNRNIRRFQLRLWDVEQRAMRRPLDFYWFEESMVRDVDDLTLELQRSNLILMQCTGIRDTNGVDIYEGDVVDAWSAGSHCTGVITWGNCGFFIAIPPPVSIWYLSGPVDPGIVLGNIYEHPEIAPVNNY